MQAYIQSCVFHKEGESMPLVLAQEMFHMNQYVILTILVPEGFFTLL